MKHEKILRNRKAISGTPKIPKEFLSVSKKFFVHEEIPKEFPVSQKNQRFFSGSQKSRSDFLGFSKKILHKKAVTFKILNMAFFRMLFITIAFIVVYLFTTSLMQEKIEIQDTKNLILVKRILYSPNSISYTDPATGRVFPGIIDLNKFNDKILNKSFNLDKNNIAAKLELKNKDTNKTTIAYLNKKWYDRWAPLSKFEQYDKTIRWRYVLIKENAQLNKGLLRIDVVVVRE